MTKDYPPDLVFSTTPAERRLLQRLRGLPQGVYLAGVTVAGGGVAELVLFNEKQPGKKETMK
jgi:hypothetical protein